MNPSEQTKASTASNALAVTFSFRPNKDKQHGKSGTDRLVKPGNVPRISKVMALAIRFEGLVRRGEVQDYADLARLGYVTPTRITQIMCLLNLAPEIQEDILFLPRTVRGRDPLKEKDARQIAAVSHWHRQRKMWAQLVRERMG